MPTTTFNFRPTTSNLTSASSPPSTSNLQPPTSNLQPPTLDLRHQRPPETMKVILHSHFPAGHTYPMQAVAQALVSHGHTVLWLTSSDNDARVLATGAHFAPTTATAVLDSPLVKAHKTGLFDLAEGRLNRRLLAQVADYRAALAVLDADVLLVDVLPHGARALHDLGEIPVYATLGVIPLYTSRLDAPLAASGAAPPASWAGRLLNAARQVVARCLETPLFLRPAMSRQRRALGLRSLPLGEPMEASTYSPHLHIQASCPRLEFNQLPGTPRHRKHTVFVGPLVAQASHDLSKLPPWWPDLPSQTKTVVGITQGTLATDPTSLIIPSISALQDDPDLVLVVVSPHGPEIQSSTRRTGNVYHAAWLPYHLLLPRLALLITNGGYGSIKQALSHGVPLLCAGQSEDKRDTGARVAYSRLGIDLKTDSPDVASVRRAAYAILGDDGYRARAREMGDELNRLGGAGAAVEALEELVRNTVP
ncbi:UDP-glucuronosyl/UDP-glucosyltransferase [Metarhizium album ARSEF 1941]|uniref:UDP-glucuronosyl/UDP-glucosyltransferase n=1 Tax=Metarhizium album (strain ARSEF 1941) TaxID=1081103 RepID=A0A0B2X959_METAS|nr:UDP-glucuronosyl/UDP-glucosyltransferase [Metarhizium album ARSEF 1941]KHO02110.1 UDP-glucuronosyl/UDP-glucosyltransferase [Metarhizium album ARSEF 1941]